MKKDTKLILIVLAGILAIVLLCIFAVQGTQNKAFTLEEQVNTAQSDIRVQEKRRVDLVYNLADCVMQYDKHEAETLTEVLEILKMLQQLSLLYPRPIQNSSQTKTIRNL